MSYISIIQIPREEYEKPDFDIEKVKEQMAKNLSELFIRDVTRHIEIECRGIVKMKPDLVSYRGEVNVEFNPYERVSISTHFLEDKIRMLQAENERIKAENRRLRTLLEDDMR